MGERMPDRVMNEVDCVVKTTATADPVSPTKIMGGVALGILNLLIETMVGRDESKFSTWIAKC